MAITDRLGGYLPNIRDKEFIAIRHYNIFINGTD